ncbi:MAG: ASCH domain-containing protein [Spirochaetaceae bacterium]|nr:ASCH domain-containing protein [Spirochaetaceae bacterium]
MLEVEKFWFEYLEKNNLPKTTPYSGEFILGEDEVSCLQLSALILGGKKTGSFTALDSFIIDNEPLPKAGSNYVVADWNEVPLCIIQTTKVTILPYNQITWEMAEKEGEEDSFESWKESHNEFFEYDAEIMGYEFKPDMPVVFEEFKVIYKKG